MNAAFFRKSLRDALPMLLLLVAAMVVFEVGYVAIIRQFANHEGKAILDMPFVRNIIRALLGSDLLASLTPTGLMTLGLAHPLVYAFCWSFVLAVGTRSTVGEIDRGTADQLLSLPMSRTAVYVSPTLVWLLGIAVLSAVPAIGIVLGVRILPLWKPLEPRLLFLVEVNLFALNVAIAGLAAFVGSLMARRGRAIGVVLGILLYSFFLNFLAQSWTPAEQFSFLGLLEYYQPLPIVEHGKLAARDLVVLFVLGGVLWLAGLWHFCRRDIPAA